MILLLLSLGCATPALPEWEEAAPLSVGPQRRAVLVGPDLADRGLDSRSSMARMDAALKEHGFTTSLLEGAAANEPRVKEAIRESWADLRRPVGEGDLLLVYMIAHGGYLLDAKEEGHPAVELAGGALVPVEELLEELDGASGAALVLDACMVGEPRVGPSHEAPAHRALLLTASEPDHPALATEAMGGVYTAALVAAMGERGGLVAAHVLARHRLVEDPPMRGDRAFSQRPTAFAGRVWSEVALGDLASDPPLLLDALSPLLSGTGMRLRVSGLTLDGAGAYELPAGPVEIDLEREGEQVGGTSRAREAEGGRPLTISAPGPLAGAPPSDWIRVGQREEPVLPTFTTEELHPGCDAVEGFVQVDLDPSTPGTELFFTCTGEEGHPSWWVWGGDRLEDRSEELGLSQLPPGTLPQSFRGGVCYIPVAPGQRPQGPLQCVGVAAPAGDFTAAPLSADLDGDGVDEAVLPLVAGAVVEDGGGRTDLGAIVSSPYLLRLDGDSSTDLIFAGPSGQIEERLELAGAWAPLSFPRVEGANGGLSIVDVGDAAWTVAMTDWSTNAATLLHRAPGEVGWKRVERVIAQGGEQYGWAGADLDLDGRTDLVGTRPATLVLARGERWQPVDLGARYQQLLPVDLDSDGDLDLVGLREGDRGVEIRWNRVPHRGLLWVEVETTHPEGVELDLVAGDRRQRVRLDGTRTKVALGLGEQRPDRLVVTWSDGSESTLTQGAFQRGTDGGWTAQVSPGRPAPVALLLGSWRVDLREWPLRPRPLPALADLARVDWARRVGALTAIEGQTRAGEVVLRWLEDSGRLRVEQVLPRTMNRASVAGDTLYARTDHPERLVLATPAGFREVDPGHRGLRGLASAFGRLWLSWGRTHISALVGDQIGPDELACPVADCTDREILIPTPDGEDLFVIDTWRPGVELWHQGALAWTQAPPEIRRPQPREGARWDPVHHRLLLPVEGGLDAITPGPTPTFTRLRVIPMDIEVLEADTLPDGRTVLLERSGAGYWLAVVDEVAGTEMRVRVDVPGGPVLGLLEGGQGSQPP